MSKKKNAIARFTVDPKNPVPKESLQALASRVEATDARPIDYDDIAELSDDWFQRAGNRLVIEHRGDAG